MKCPFRFPERERMSLLDLEQPAALESSPHRAHPAVRHVRAAGHDLDIYTESPPLIAAMLRDIQAAQRRVWLESYIYVADDAGKAIGEALKERVRAGADVRLVYDAVGSARTSGAFFDDLRRAGVQVHAYHSFAEALTQLAPLHVLNRRDHRKLLVVDDHAAYFGGMNILDQTGLTTVAAAKARHLPSSAGWRDVHVRLTGPKQALVADAFDGLWQRAHLKRKISWPAWPIAQMLDSSDEDVWFFDSQPRWRQRSPVRVFLPLIRQARREITLSMAYFLPVGRLLREIYRARRRGVLVRVIVPAQSDVKLVQAATRHLYDKLLRRGIEIHERQEQMLHGKTMVVDELWGIVGSCNFDPRSLWHNLEFLAVFRSEPMAAALREICEFEIGHSRRVTLRDVENRPWWQRLADRAAYSMRRWL
jgi:cardiolipin synthase